MKNILFCIGFLSLCISIHSLEVPQCSKDAQVFAGEVSRVFMNSFYTVFAVPKDSQDTWVPVQTCSLKSSIESALLNVSEELYSKQLYTNTEVLHHAADLVAKSETVLAALPRKFVTRQEQRDRIIDATETIIEKKDRELGIFYSDDPNTLRVAITDAAKSRKFNRVFIILSALIYDKTQIKNQSNGSSSDDD